MMMINDCTGAHSVSDAQASSSYSSLIYDWLHTVPQCCLELEDSESVKHNTVIHCGWIARVSSGALLAVTAPSQGWVKTALLRSVTMCSLPSELQYCTVVCTFLHSVRYFLW